MEHIVYDIEVKNSQESQLKSKSKNGSIRNYIRVLIEAINRAWKLQRNFEYKNTNIHERINVIMKVLTRDEINER